MNAEDGSMGFASVVARALYCAVSSQLGVLEAAPPIPPNALQTNSSENGHALCVVVLSVVVLESAINRMRHLGRLQARVQAIDYFGQVVGRRRALYRDSEEVFALRDAIVHNHIWTGRFVSDDERNTLRLVTQLRLEPWSGDKRRERVTNPTTQRTHRLRLNMVPTRIWRRDAYLALRTVLRAVKRLEKIEPRLAITRAPIVLTRWVPGSPPRLRHESTNHEEMLAHIRDRLKRLPRQRPVGIIPLSLP